MSRFLPSPVILLPNSLIIEQMSLWKAVRIYYNFAYNLTQLGMEYVSISPFPDFFFWCDCNTWVDTGLTLLLSREIYKSTFVVVRNQKPGSRVTSSLLLARTGLLFLLSSWSFAFIMWCKQSMKNTLTTVIISITLR